MNAARFRDVIDGDYPVGSEEERRRTAGVRVNAAETVFSDGHGTVRKEPAIRNVKASGPGELEVELRNGRIHRWTISGVDQEGAPVTARVEEFRNGVALRKAIVK